VSAVSVMNASSTSVECMVLCVGEDSSLCRRRCAGVVFTSAHMAATGSDAGWPLASATARLLWLRAVCAVAEGADVPLSHTVAEGSSSSSSSSSSWSPCFPPDVCVAAVLGDALHRMSVLGGREGMPRSLGSVYGGSVTRFLGGSLRGVVSRVIDADLPSRYNGVAVSRDGRTLLLSDSGYYSSHAVHEFGIADGRHRVVGGGDHWLQFEDPRQVCIAPDGFVFVAEQDRNRVQVLTPSLDFHRFIGEGALERPVGVCASADIVVVASQSGARRVAVFSRSDGALLRRFASYGRARDQLKTPMELCFVSGDRHVAVADHGNARVSVFSVDGEFIRHVGVGVLSGPISVAASAFDELVVADMGDTCLRLFSGTGDVLARVCVLGKGRASGIAMHGSTVFAAQGMSKRVLVLN
jgi:hypothetical protein